MYNCHWHIGLTASKYINSCQIHALAKTKLALAKQFISPREVNHILTGMGRGWLHRTALNAPSRRAARSLPKAASIEGTPNDRIARSINIQPGHVRTSGPTLKTGCTRRYYGRIDSGISRAESADRSPLPAGETRVCSFCLPSSPCVHVLPPLGLGSSVDGCHANARGTAVAYLFLPVVGPFGSTTTSRLVCFSLGYILRRLLLLYQVCGPLNLSSA